MGFNRNFKGDWSATAADKLRVVHTKVTSFLKSMSERGGFDIERLQIE